MMRKSYACGHLYIAVVRSVQNLFSYGGMGFHDFDFLGGERGGFQQNGVGKGDFADVMQAAQPAGMAFIFSGAIFNGTG
jgi:hypothetical protein